METHRSFENGGNWPLKEGKMGLTGKDGETPPGKALFTVRRNRVLSKGILLPSPLIVKILFYKRRAIGIPSPRKAGK